MSVLQLKQQYVNNVLQIGKITCGLLAHRIAENAFDGDNEEKDVMELEKLWSYLDAMKDYKELNDTGEVRTTTYTYSTQYRLGDYYHGGIIFNITGTNVLIAAPRDLFGGGWKWSPGNPNNPAEQPIVIHDISTTDIDGETNSTNIVNYFTGALPADTVYAAKKIDTYSANGYSDWFMPSKLQLQSLMNYAALEYPTYDAMRRDPINGTPYFNSPLGNFMSTVLNQSFWASSQYTTTPNPTNNSDYQAAYVVSINEYYSGPRRLVRVTTTGQTKWTGNGIKAIRKDTISAPTMTPTVSTTTDDAYIVEEYQNWLSDATAKTTLEKILRMSRRYLPSLVINKLLQNTTITLQ